MRDLNDYKAEIFRRSEEKIKERKKIYNRALAFCVPLCFVFAAIAFAELPDISASDISTENVSSDVDFLFPLPEIQESLAKLPNGFAFNVEESPEIWSLIQSAFETAVQKEDTADDHRYVATSQTVVQDSLSLFSDSKYEMYFVNKNGDVFTYTLEGNVLTDVTTKEKVTLSSEQVFELQNKLGIIKVWEEEK